MNDQAESLNAPAWAAVVRELMQPAPDARAFSERLVDVAHRVCGARAGGLYESRGETAELVAGEPPESTERAAAAALAALAHDRTVVDVKPDSGIYDPGARRESPVVATPVRTPGVARGVLVFELEPRSPSALQTTVALLELLSGYAASDERERRARETRSASATLDLAGAMLAMVNDAGSFNAAGLAVCDGLVRELNADRITLGWNVAPSAPDGRIRVIAASDTEKIDRRSGVTRRLEHAMDECLDQAHAVLSPAPGEDEDRVLGAAVTAAHRELTGGRPNARAATLPMRDGDRVLGVLSIESTVPASDPAFLSAHMVARLQPACDLLGPVLRLKRRDDRGPIARLRDDGLRAARWTLGPERIGAKLAGLAVVALLAASLIVTTEQHVRAPVLLEAGATRAVSAPFGGLIAETAAGVESGAAVAAGDVLVRMDAGELRLRAAEARAELERANADADDARRKNALADVRRAEAEAAQLRARIALLDDRIARAEITAPLSGIIVGGDPSRLAGSSVSLGESICRIAAIDELSAYAEISDRDLAYVRPGSTGELATRARPGERFSFTVDRIEPAPEQRGGGIKPGVFRVKVTLDEPAGWMRPGQEGVAVFDAGEATIAAGLSRRLTDAARLWLWW